MIKALLQKLMLHNFLMSQENFEWKNILQTGFQKAIRR